MEKVSKKEKVGLRELIIVSMFSVIAFLLMYVRMRFSLHHHSWMLIFQKCQHL